MGLASRNMDEYKTASYSVHRVNPGLSSPDLSCDEVLRKINFIRDFITSSLRDTLDPLQFAYHPNRSTEDAIAHLYHTALSHLDSRKHYVKNYVKMLFVVYSSAFNTIIPSILTTKFEILGLSPSLKTKELIVDFSTKQERNYQPLIINGTPVERVDNFWYLGVHITQDLSWSCHVNTLVKKARQHLYHLRCLKDFKLHLFTIESIQTGSITAWFENSTKQDRQALQDQ
ncbi:hypothetical protein QTP86_027416, partial [Hemibagrus guttatus]